MTRHFALPGDRYSFAGSPMIRHIAACGECARWSFPQAYREFTTAAARDEWAEEHEQTRPKHQVAISTEVHA